MEDSKKPVDYDSRTGNEGYQPTRPSSPLPSQPIGDGYQPVTQTETAQEFAPPPKKR